MAQIKITNQTAPSTPVSGITSIYVDSSSKKLSGIDDAGLVTVYETANAINGAGNKSTPVDADKFGIWDSISGLLKNVTWANIKVLLYALGTNLDGAAATLIGFKGVANTQTNDYQTQASDLGKVVIMNKSTACTLTVHSTAPAGWNCLVIQQGAGQVSIVASGGNVRNSASQTKLRTQYSVATLYVLSNAGTAPEVYLAGDTGA
jgi:hypothetical protein